MTDKPVNGSAAAAPSDLAIQPIRAENLYKQEIYSDPERGTIIVQVPVYFDANDQRPYIFGGQIIAQTNRGPMPLQFVIPNVTTLEEAVAAWPAAVLAAAREMQNQQVRSQLLQPGAIDTSHIRNKR